MSRYIVLYNFNKYYNRKIKRLATFADYQALITPQGTNPAQYRGFVREKKNFNYADGIYAKHTINIDKNEPVFAKAEQPDYFVLEQSYKDGENTVTKVTRWFVLEASRDVGNQYTLSLRRDLLADYYNEVLTAPVFIERGSPQVYSDPAIFNKEGFTFNQIKKYELLLNRNKMSGNRSGWVVGYINRTDPGDEDHGTIGPCDCSQEINLDSPDYDNLPQKLKDLIDAGHGTLNPTNEVNIQLPITIRQHAEGGGWHTRHRVIQVGLNNLYAEYYSIQDITTFGNGASTRFQWRGSYEEYNFTNDDNVLAYVRDKMLYYDDLGHDFNTYAETQAGPLYFDRNFLTVYDNTYYKKDGKYYRITFNQREAGGLIEKRYTGAQLKSSYDSIASSAMVMIRSLWDDHQVTENPNWDLNATSIIVYRSLESYDITVEEIDNATFSVTIPNTRNKLLDSPYDMFVMPLGATKVRLSGGTDFTTLLNTSLAAARGIAATGTSSRILDVQILPYCPIPEILKTSGIDIDLTNKIEGKDYTLIQKTIGGSTINLGVILYPLHSQGTFTYDLYRSNILGNQEYTEDDVQFLRETLFGSEVVFDKKVISETRLVRFVAPNFSAIYDVNPQKNGNLGIVNISIDYYYKPYTPYIHVMPVLNDDMYGKDYNDPKGLICSGDFSIATASSKWEEYQVQNKNFQEQFDRQIANLDKNNSIAMQQATVTGAIGIGTSTLSGAAAGAIAGSFIPVIGTAIGALVGAAGGALASGVGYAKDIELLKQQQSEARSYAKDMYTYQLGNVQALPNTLTKVSAFTPNNKIFPFIEIYDCTEEEKEALRNKIKYNGMTIMRIGHIQDYINSDVTYYVQGQLIRLEGIDEDSHVVAEIANEIKEGAYYYGSDTSES